MTSCRYYFEENDHIGQCSQKSGSCRVPCTGNHNEETCPTAIAVIIEMEKLLGVKLRHSDKDESKS